MTNFKLYETRAINHTTGEIFQYNLKGRNPQEAIRKIVKKLNRFYDFYNDNITQHIFEFSAEEI